MIAKIAFRRCVHALAVLLALAVPLAAAPAKILLVTTAAGFNHKEGRAFAKVVLDEIGRRSGLFDLTFDHNVTFKFSDDKECNSPKFKDDAEALKLITPEGLKGFDAVAFYTTGDQKEFPLSEENRNALIDFVKGGKAFIGFHSATDTFKDWEPYREMIGGSFSGHPWHEDVKIDIEDPSHPAAAPLGDSWTIKDEIYQFQNYSREKLHVILSLNEQHAAKGGRPDKDYPVAWCKAFGKGRVFYTSLGHRADVWQNPLYGAHVLGGIRWALGLALGDARHGTAKPSNEWKRLFSDPKSCPRSGNATWDLLSDGTLKGHQEQGHIFTAESYRNFHLRAKCNISEGGNSGMYFRCKDHNTWPTGYEAQINNSHGDPVRTGSLYNKDKVYQRLVPIGEPWFTQEVIAVENHIIIKVNGKVVVDRLDDQFKEGTFAFQQHNVGSEIMLRDVEVRQLP